MMKKYLLVLLVTATMFSLSFNAFAKTNSNELTEKEALKIALSARDHFWNAIAGHDPVAEHSNCPQKTFAYKNTEYIYMCKNLDSKKKLVHYLSRTFTYHSIDKGMKRYNFIVYKGKLARPAGDGESMLVWEKASSKLTFKKTGVRQYEFTVPTVDDIQPVKKKVTFVKIQDKWKINEIDSVL